MSRSFRAEFLNRIDRVIVFRPFDRPQMRALLQKELRDVLARRGLRTRPWAVELDEGASEFIIDQGFTPELGARPLKRAVERHLLAPLAKVIVEQTAPKGDLFLFVSHTRQRGITVSFVNLEAPEDSPRTRVERSESGNGSAFDVRPLALSGRADPHEVQHLLAELDALSDQVEGDAEERKQVALRAMALRASGKTTRALRRSPRSSISNACRTRPRLRSVWVPDLGARQTTRLGQHRQSHLAARVAAPRAACGTPRAGEGCSP